MKTRLSPPLDEDAAARLYRAFLEDFLNGLGKLELGRRVLFTSGKAPADSDSWETIAPSGWELVAQVKGDLGRRLTSAFEELHASGPGLMVGSDSPTLPPSYVRRAAELVHESDLVLGPCTDGGYYLIGLERSVPDLFREIPWSTEEVLEATAGVAERLGLRLALLPPWYDVDTPEDLAFLATHVRLMDAVQDQAPGRQSSAAPRTAALLEEFRKAGVFSRDPVD